MVAQPQAYIVTTVLSDVRSSSRQLPCHSVPARQAALHRQRGRSAVHAQRSARCFVPHVRRRRHQCYCQRNRLDFVADVSSRHSLWFQGTDTHEQSVTSYRNYWLIAFYIRLNTLVDQQKTFHTSSWSFISADGWMLNGPSLSMLGGLLWAAATVPVYSSLPPVCH